MELIKKNISLSRVNSELSKQKVSPPRVAEANNSATQKVRRSPRLAQNEANKRHLQIYTRGTHVYKKFGTKYYQGIIRDFDAKEGYYKVKYNDGDTEEYTKEEIKTMLHKPDIRNIQQAMSVMRHARVEAQYIQTNLYYKPAPIGSCSGFGKAMDWIEYQELNRNKNNPTFQGYKYANTVLDEESGCMLELRDLLKHPKHSKISTIAACKEYGCLFQGYGKNTDGTKIAEGTNTCHWCPKSKVPKHKKATYAQYVVDVRPEKEDPNRVRITAGGNRLDYFGETSTITASLETAKILINSVLSNKNAKFMAMDISNFYIQNDLEDYQYIQFHISMIPQEIIDE